MSGGGTGPGGARRQGQTWAGCFLLLATVVITLVGGVYLTVWLRSFGVVSVSLVVGLGLAVYFAGWALLRSLGVRVWEDDEGRGGDGHAGGG